MDIPGSHNVIPNSELGMLASERKLSVYAIGEQLAHKTRRTSEVRRCGSGGSQPANTVKTRSRLRALI